MKNLNLARTVLFLNAIFSMLCGTLFLFFTGEVSKQLFINVNSQVNAITFWLGIGLVLFSIGIFFISTNPYVKKKQVMQIVFADIAWVIVSLFIYIFDKHYFTSTGLYLLDFVALVVALFAMGQYIGAKRIKPQQSEVTIEIVNKKIIASVSRKTRASIGVVWDVMIDHTNYWEVASNLSNSEVVSGEGLGLVRRCYGSKGENWLETCNKYNEGKSYSFVIHTEAEDYPYPFLKLNGNWALKQLNDQPEFSIAIEMTPKGGYIAKHLFYLASKRQITMILIKLADKWCQKMELKDGLVT